MSKVFGERILEGRSAFVMGGTRGMNLEIARRYAEHGAAVTVCSRSPERCAAAEAELKAVTDRALGIPVDARDYDQVAAALARAAEAFGPLDIVIAGQAGNFMAPVLGMSSNGFKTVVDIDLFGTFNTFKASWEHLRKPGASAAAT